ncbi:Ig-like domain-containing protein [Marinicellulosiphila megalodicopiae]|uniref:Ig-like domain-containing protein n=1 Tax=Marinicellulosiphila megalodicopiae TaxID=2724896 RepID=UPI003BB1DA3D
MKFYTNKILSIISIAALFSFTSIYTLAANIEIHIDDEAGEGFNDPTFGANRLKVFEQAAAMLSNYLRSEIDIIVLARFDELTCTPSSATLGSASPFSTAYNFKNAPHQDTLYPIALANAIAKEDLEPEKPDITAIFNSNLDSGNCLGGSTWYYEYDQAPNNKVSLLEVVLHELIHGLGFISTVSEDGSRLFYQWIDANGNVLDTIYLDDPFMKHLVNGNGQNWGDLDGTHDEAGNNIRAQDSISNNLFFTGPNTNLATTTKSDGVTNNLIKMYTPSTYKSASNVSHFDTSATPDEVMEPYNTGKADGIGLAFHVLKDIGWPSKNIAPIITGQSTITTNEDTALTLNYNSIQVTDNDSNYPLVFSLTVFNGDNYTLANDQIVPAKNFYGTLTVPIQINDSSDDSNIFDLSIDVLPINDSPVISGQTGISLLEDSSISINIDHVLVTDIENDDIELIILEGEDYQVFNEQITPNVDFNGDLRVNIQATDGQSISDTYELSIAVLPINDSPSFDMPFEYLAAIDQSTTISLIANDADQDDLIFSATNLPNWLIIHNQTLYGTPTISDLGKHVVTIEVTDNEATITQEITINVNETRPIDFSITTIDQNLLTTINSIKTVSFQISGSGQKEQQTIYVDITSLSPIKNDQCSEIINGLRCPVSLFNDQTSLDVTITSPDFGSIKIDANISDIPTGTQDSNLANQSNSLWVSFLSKSTLNLNKQANIKFENEITHLTSIFDEQLLSLSFKNQDSQLIIPNTQSQYSIISHFAQNHDTNKVEIMDLNEDNQFDLVVTSNLEPSKVYLGSQNTLIESNTFNELPIESINQSAVINNQTIIISDDQTLYILQSNLLDRFIEQSRLTIEGVSGIQVIDINNDNYKDLILTTNTNQLYIFSGTDSQESLFESTGRGYNISDIKFAHAINFDQTNLLLISDASGLSIHSVIDSALIFMQKLNIGEITSIITNSQNNTFTALNQSGSLFVFQWDNNSISLKAAAHSSFTTHIAQLPNTNGFFTIWTASNRDLNAFTFEQTITDTPNQTDTTTQIDPISNTDTDTQTETEISHEISDLIEPEEPTKSNNIKLGHINLIWLALCLAIVLRRRIRKI